MYKKLQRSFKATIVTGDVSKKKSYPKWKGFMFRQKLRRWFDSWQIAFCNLDTFLIQFGAFEICICKYTLFTEMKAGRLRFFCTGKHVKTHLVERVNKRDFLYICIWEFFVFSRGKRGNKKFATMSRNCWSVGMSEMTLMLWPSLFVFWRLDCNLSDEKEYNFKVIKRRGEDTFS